MARVGKRVGLGMVVGLVVGVAAGLIVGLLIHAHSYTFWGYVFGLGIFGLIAGGFVGGMTSLADPGIGDEPTDPVD
jgi:hypothetical protein